MKKKQRVILILGCLTAVISLFAVFYPYPLRIWENYSDTYLQAYKLVKTRALIGKTYDECYDILQDHGIDVNTEKKYFNSYINEKNPVYFYAKFTYDAGIILVGYVDNYNRALLILYFDDNMTVKKAFLEPYFMG